MNRPPPSLTGIEDGEFRSRSPAQAIQRAQGIVRHRVSRDVSLADELIAERRREAGQG